MIAENGAARFPGIDGGEWIQGRLSTADCKGLVTLVDFWDYTNVHCIRSFPYLKEWHEQYAHLGLLVVGVHAAEFEFARKRRNARRAIDAFDLPYPVVLDTRFKIRNAFANRLCPARYLFDTGGCLRYTHCGRGATPGPNGPSGPCCGSAAQARPPVESLNHSRRLASS